jgi:hypothetical protein
MGGRGASGGSGFAVKGFSKHGLTIHHREHAQEFSPPGHLISPEEYEAKAIVFMDRLVGGDIDGFTTSGDVVWRYSTKDNIFGKANANGQIITFFKPGKDEKGKIHKDRGRKYWEDEKEEHFLD